MRSGLRPATIALALLTCSSGAGKPARSDDNATFRPTVLVRKGSSQGSGTIVRSVAGETLILTAAHVVDAEGPLVVELHRYNLGLEIPATAGGWPRRRPGEVAAVDTPADLALVRMKGMVALPYVARLAVDREPAPGAAVTSVGIDRATKLSSWGTRVLGVERLAIRGKGPDRTFIVTAKAPEHGRSGGGLFDERGALVGVCVGRVELDRLKLDDLGIFASSASVAALLRANKLDRLARAPRPTGPTNLSSGRPGTPGLEPSHDWGPCRGRAEAKAAEVGRAHPRRPSRHHRRPEVARHESKLARSRAATARQ